MQAMANTYELLDQLDPIERELYRILKTFIDNSTFEAFPSLKTLTIRLKRCRNTVKKYLKNLEIKGFIYQ